MTKKNAKRLVVTAETVFEPGYVDLDRKHSTWPDGTPLTEKSAEEYTIRRAGGGRPSLGGRAGASPSVAFRVSRELRHEAGEIAAREGKTVSEVARAALEQYVEQHRRSA